MAFELGYSIDRVSKLLSYFIKSGKILYSEDTKEIALKNWMKYNGSTSPKVVSCINSELSQIKDRVLIEYVNGMYTASQEEQEEEQEEEKNNRFKIPTKEEINSEFPGFDAERFIDFYSSKGWMVGKNKMKDWKASVRTWLRSSDQKTELAAPKYKKATL